LAPPNLIPERSILPVTVPVVAFVSLFSACVATSLFVAVSVFDESLSVSFAVASAVSASASSCAASVLSS